MAGGAVRRRRPARAGPDALGFVEAIPFPPEGEALLRRLGPELAAVARELGILRER